MKVSWLREQFAHLRRDLLLFRRRHFEGRVGLLLLVGCRELFVVVVRGSQCIEDVLGRLLIGAWWRRRSELRFVCIVGSAMLIVRRWASSLLLEWCGVAKLDSEVISEHQKVDAWEQPLEPHGSDSNDLSSLAT